MHNLVLETLSECRKRIAMGIQTPHNYTPELLRAPHLSTFEAATPWFRVPHLPPYGNWQVVMIPKATGGAAGGGVLHFVSFPLSSQLINFPPYSLFFFQNFHLFFPPPFLLLHTKRQPWE